MITANFKGIVIAQTSAMQWDYGQTIELTGAAIDIPDGTEAQFYQGNLSHTGQIKDMECEVPDVMLQNACSITMYIYVRDATSGETVLTVNIKVDRRPRPKHYVLPAYEEYTRLLPEGGEDGQVPIVGVDESGNRTIGWGNRADSIKLIDGALQLMSGDKEIGERVRLPGGSSGNREIELRKTETAIQWRYTDSNEWTDLIQIEDLRGPAGETPVLERRGDHLWAVYEN